MPVLRPRLLVAETEGFTPAVVAGLREWADVDFGPVLPGQIGETLRAFEIVWIRLGHRVQAADIPAECRCRLIAVTATGLDHIDLAACARAGIRLATLKGEVAFLREVRATAEHTIALVLGLLRRLPAAHASVLAGRWDRDAFRGRELHGRTAGIVGLGRLGSMVAGYFRAFGMDVCGYDPRSDFPAALAQRCGSLDELFAAADVVSVHVAYDASTRHLITARHFAQARSGAVIVNTSRGGVIDPAALLAALAEGRIAGAALDVIDGEPDVGREHPLVAYARDHDNLILTPHIAGNTSDSLAKAEAFIAAKARRIWEEITRP
jgi:D-3-phosphoglycerate dehydrogenase